MTIAIFSREMSNRWCFVLVAFGLRGVSTAPRQWLLWLAIVNKVITVHAVSLNLEVICDWGYCSLRSSILITFGGSAIISTWRDFRSMLFSLWFLHSSKLHLRKVNGEEQYLIARTAYTRLAKTY